MLKLAENFAKGRNLKESYNKLIQMLEKVGMKSEECFTIESLCRVLKTKKEKQKMVQKIVDINTRGLDSYDTYCMNITSVRHEFPIDNKSVNALVLIVDRYMALMHILTMIKNIETNTAKIVIEYASQVEQEYYMAVVNYPELKQHAESVMSAAELLAAKNMKDFDDVEILVNSVAFGYRDKDIYPKILDKYKEDLSISFKQKIT